MKKESIGTLAIKIQFYQDRANRFDLRVQEVERKLRALEHLRETLADKMDKYSQQAAGLRGIREHMIKNNYVSAMVENGSYVFQSEAR